MTEEVGRRLINNVWVTNVESQGGSGGGGITRVTSDDETVTITNPTGPTVDLSANGGSQPEAIVVRGFDIPLAAIIAAWDAGTGTADVPFSHTYQAGEMLYDFVLRTLEAVTVPPGVGVNVGVFFGAAGSEEWLSATDGGADPVAGDASAEELDTYTILGIPDPDSNDGPRTAIGATGLGNGTMGTGFMLTNGAPTIRFNLGSPGIAPTTGHVQVYIASCTPTMVT